MKPRKIYFVYINDINTMNGDPINGNNDKDEKIALIDLLSCISTLNFHIKTF